MSLLASVVIAASVTSTTPISSVTSSVEATAPDAVVRVSTPSAVAAESVAVATAAVATATDDRLVNGSGDSVVMSKLSGLLSMLPMKPTLTPTTVSAFQTMSTSEASPSPTTFPPASALPIPASDTGLSFQSSGSDGGIHCFIDLIIIINILNVSTQALSAPGGFRVQHRPYGTLYPSQFVPLTV